MARTAPWRNVKHVGQSFMKSMGWTDKTQLQKLDFENTCTDIGHTNGKHFPAQCCINCFCECNPNEKSHQISSKENLENPLSLCEHSNRFSKKCKYVKPRNCMVSGGVELVPLLARRRALQRPISLSTTDVTKYTK